MYVTYFVINVPMNMRLLLYALTVLFLYPQSIQTGYKVNIANSCKKLYNYPIRCWSKDCFYNPSIMATVPLIIQNNGYRYEIHQVITEDGYILTLHRIVHKNGTQSNGPPCFLQHGIEADASNWVATGERALAFQLFKRGYDVWMGNMRGSRYSKRHIKLQESDPKFWLFSVDDIALQDLPTSLEYVSNVTKKKIIYVGHSLGGTTITMLSAMYPEKVNKMIDLAFLLAPAVNVNKISSQWSPVFTFGNIVGVSFTSMTISVPTLAHISQVHNTGKLQRYNHGHQTNLLKYGQAKPPTYNISKFSIQEVHIYYSTEDALVLPQGVFKFYDQIESPAKFITRVPINNLAASHKFNHLDYIYSGYLSTALYPDIFAVLKRYSPK